MEQEMHELKEAKWIYAGGGYQWEPGEVPMCSMCFENVATRATVHLGILLCDDSNCHTAYVMQECDEIECFEEGDQDDG